MKVKGGGTTVSGAEMQGMDISWKEEQKRNCGAWWVCKQCAVKGRVIRGWRWEESQGREQGRGATGGHEVAAAERCKTALA